MIAWIEVENTNKSLETILYDLGVDDLMWLGLDTIHTASRFVAMRARIVFQDAQRGEEDCVPEKTKEVTSTGVQPS